MCCHWKIRVASHDPYRILGTVDVAMTQVKDPFTCAADIDSNLQFQLFVANMNLYISRNLKSMRAISTGWEVHVYVMNLRPIDQTWNNYRW